VYLLEDGVGQVNVGKYRTKRNTWKIRNCSLQLALFN
jgi:hypothetical protein